MLTRHDFATKVNENYATTSWLETTKNCKEINVPISDVPNAFICGDFYSDRKSFIRESIKRAHALGWGIVFLTNDEKTYNEFSKMDNVVLSAFKPEEQVRIAMWVKEEMYFRRNCLNYDNIDDDNLWHTTPLLFIIDNLSKVREGIEYICGNECSQFFEECVYDISSLGRWSKIPLLIGEVEISDKTFYSPLLYRVRVSICIDKSLGYDYDDSDSRDIKFCVKNDDKKENPIEGTFWFDGSSDNILSNKNSDFEETYNIYPHYKVQVKTQTEYKAPKLEELIVLPVK